MAFSSADAGGRVGAARSTTKLASTPSTHEPALLPPGAARTRPSLMRSTYTLFPSPNRARMNRRPPSPPVQPKPSLSAPRRRPA